MKTKILLCSDLDRTILPNGPQEESPQARKVLAQLARRPELILVYVSGRDKKLLREAIEGFAVPIPDYAIGDVGTTIYETHGNVWKPWEDWAQEIAQDWNGMEHDALAALLEGFEELRPQEPEKQNTFKVSYYADLVVNPAELTEAIRRRLTAKNVQASVIWSIDEPRRIGLLDILPERATKLHAIRFLMQKKAFPESGTVFAGDSGNDMPALTSGLQAVLVKNAMQQVREEAIEIASAKGIRDRLYLAQGNFFGMNGNYAAGVIEGLAHFLPETRVWIEAALR
jgi:sucrose-6F-phosphate phosphohydrolase